MKKLFSLLLALLICASLIPASAETSSTKTYKGTITVDGVMEDEWKYAEEFTANEHESNHWTASTDPKTASTKFRTLWDENYIYVWCEITDPTVVTATRASHWLTDCMIYHVDYANNKSGGFDATKAGYLYVTAGKGLVQASQVFEGAIDAFKSSHKLVSGGWIIEMAIPAKAIDFKLSEGMKIGFEPQYNDSNDASASGGRVGLCTWNLKGAGGYNNTSVYGTLILSGISPSKPKEEPKEDPKEDPKTDDETEPTSPTTADFILFPAVLALTALSGFAVVRRRRK